MKFDHTKPFKTRAGKAVELVTAKGRGDRKFVGYIDNQKDIATWLANGRYLHNGESGFDLVNVDPFEELKAAYADGKVIEYNCGTADRPEWEVISSPTFEGSLQYYRVKPWKLPAPPEGMQWHRNDWTEDMLPEGWRPMLLNETGSYEYLNNNGIWEYGCCNRAPTLAHYRHTRTNRPLPSAPKKVPLTFEYVSGFVGVEVRVDTHRIFSVIEIGHKAIEINNVCITWEILQRNAWQWRSVQNPTWQPCEMEENV